MTSEAELLPCPFCGGGGEMSFYARAKSPAPAGYFIECTTCAASGGSIEIQGEAPDRVEYTQAEAVAAWNTRAATHPVQGEAVAWRYKEKHCRDITPWSYRETKPHPAENDDIEPLFAAPPPVGEGVREVVARLAEIAAAVEFAPGDGITFRESGAVKLAADIRTALAALTPPAGGEG